MASTNSTVNYALGQFVGTDKPSWLTDYNGDMIKIDLAIKTIDDLASAADTKGTNALASVGVLQTSVTAILADIALLNPYKAKVDALETALPLKADNVSPTFQGIMNLEGGQIKFPAIQVPSADANTLDDYEEGTWTPAITNTTNGTKTYSAQSGSYIKIGKLVFCKFIIVLSSNVGSSGATKITGLPFASTGIASAVFGLIDGITMSAGYTVGIAGYVNESSIELKSLSDGSFAEILGSNISGTAQIRGSIIYEQS